MIQNSQSGSASLQAVPAKRSRLSHYLAAAVVVGCATLLFIPVGSVLGYRAIALLLLLVVVLLALFIGRGPTLLAATLSAVLWDFFFLAPIHNLRITDIDDAILFGMYFVVALVLGELTARTRVQERATREGEERARALFSLTRELSGAVDQQQLAQKAADELSRAFGAKVVMLLPSPGGGLQPQPGGGFSLAQAERQAAAQAFDQGLPAGMSPENRAAERTLFLPLKTDSGKAGVVGLRFTGPPSHRTQSLATLEQFSQQIALAVDRLRLRAEAERTKLLAESELLSKTLLDTMSHEIRTPITAIQSAVSNLLELGDGARLGPEREMVAEIEEAARRLDRLAGNVLEITRLESGRVRPRMVLCDVGDLVHVALKEARGLLARQAVTEAVVPRLPLVWMDYVLMQGALGNLLSNAALHTPPGTAVKISAYREGEAVVIEVADRGPGIAAEALPRIFEKFYRAPSAPTGGTGLGLFLVKGLVEAQGGTVQAQCLPEGGTTFKIRVPAGNQPSPSAKTNL